MFGRTKVAMLVAEFLGTATLTSVVLAVASLANPRFGLPAFFVASGAGLVAGLMVLLIGRHSGAHLNPAITLGRWVLRQTPTTQAIAYIAVQLLGGLAALGLYQYLTGQNLSEIAAKEFAWEVFTAEAVGAFIFAWGVAAAVSQAYVGWTLAVTVGASLMLGMVVASVASNGLVNPAVALGTNSLRPFAGGKAYLFAPLVGGVVAMLVHQYLFAPAPARVAAKATRTTTTARTRGRGRRTTGAKRRTRR